jgi:hypothetical protein
MNTIDRNLTVFEAHCLLNHHEFEAYDFSDFVYGERIIRTTDGQDFALLTIEDPVVEELKGLLDRIYDGELDELERARVFNQLFGPTCDPLNGKQLDASARIACPICKSSQISHREFDPPRFKGFAIPVISHEIWSTMNPEQKLSLIEEGLRAKGLL